MSAGKRPQLHRQIGDRKEAGYGDQAPTIAAELAVHFERAQDTDRAVHYVRHAADQAMQRSVYAEVIRHCTKGLALLEALPSTPERIQQALAHPESIALALDCATHESRWEAELYRLRGELLLAQEGLQPSVKDTGPQGEAAEACFQHALTIARRQQAKSFELRTAMSLSRLWQQQDKRTAAYDLIAPVYCWFSEGFDTADLQEARALLEELGR